MRLYLSAPLLCLATLGCHTDYVDGIEAMQLEPASISMNDSSPAEGAVAGSLAVTSSSEDTWSLTLTGDTTLKLSVHAPGGSDLLSLDGRTVDLEIGDDPVYGELAIQDDQGALFLTQSHTWNTLATELMGEGFAAYGQEVGREKTEYYTFHYQSVIFAADDGEHELLPGQAAEIVRNGTHYRVILLSAYTWSEPSFSLAQPGCSPTDRMAFELIRVEQTPDLNAVQRKTPAEEPGCGL